MPILTDDKEQANGTKQDPYKKIQDLNNAALKILALGMSNSRFMGKFGLPHALLHSLVHIMLTVFGGFELICSLMLSETNLELIGHLYVVSYVWCFGFQFAYMCSITEEIADEKPEIEHFHTTRMVPETANCVLQSNLKSFVRIINLFVVIEVSASLIYFFGAFFEVGVALYTTGTVEEVYILSYFPKIPFWGQVIIAATNIITTIIVVAMIISVFMITGVWAVKIKTQCEVINAALAKKDVDFTKCIQDHIEIIKIAKRTIEILQILNNPYFYVVYILVAVQLLNLTMIEASSSYFFAMGFDFLCTFMMLYTQSWFSSYITNSLESIADGAYFTEWCGKEKGHVKSVMIMMSVAQRPHEQWIWLNSLKIERATILGMLQSSYSFYTLLMIIQGKH